MPDLFISYSRRDTEFVRKLADKLTDAGREIWVDWEDIPLTADWWKEIQEGIDGSDTFIFIISPDSVQSKVCRQELDHAIDTNKRFVPVLYREIETKEDREAMHPAISTHNWLYFRETDDFDKAFNSLNEVVELDLDHTKTHTRLLVRAKEWDAGNRDRSFLLVSDEITNAESWLSHGVSKDPKPTELHSEYIFASRAAANRRQQQLLAGVSFALVVSVVLAIAAIFGFQQASQQRDRAEEQQRIAERNADIAGSLNLATSAQLELVNNQNDLALLLGLEAVQIDDPPTQSRRILEEAVFTPGTAGLFGEHNNTIYHIDVSHDGETAVSSDREGRLLIWNIADQSLVQELQVEVAEDVAEESNIYRTWMVRYSPDDTQLLSTGTDQVIRLWDLENGDMIRDFAGEHGAQARTIIWHPDGERFVSGADDGTIILWDATTGDVIRRYENPDADPETPQQGGSIRSVAVHPNGETLLSGGLDGTIYEWDLESGEFLRTLAPHGDSVNSMYFSEDSSLIVTGSGDTNARVYDAETGDIVARLEGGHSFWIKEAHFVPNTTYIFTVSDDSTANLWDYTTESIIETFTDHTGFLDAGAVSRDGRFGLSGGGDNTIRVWELVNGAQVTALFGHTGSITDTTFNNEQTEAISSGSELLRWDVANNTILTTYDGDDDGHTNTIQGVAFSPDEASFVAVDLDGGIILWETQSGEIIRRFEGGHETGVSAVAFSNDGTQIATGSLRPENRIVLWDAETGDIIQQFDGHEDGLSAIVFTNDDETIISGAQDDAVFIWSLDGGDPAIIEAHTDTVSDIALSADNTLLATASFDNTINIWDVATGNLQLTLDGHTASVSGVDFNSDASLVISVSADNSIRIWDVATGAQLREIVAPASVTSVKFGADDQTAITGHNDGVVRTWVAQPLTLEELIGLANSQRYVRDFTEDELSRYEAALAVDDE